MGQPAPFKGPFAKRRPAGCNGRRGRRQPLHSTLEWPANAGFRWRCEKSTADCGAGKGRQGGRGGGCMGRGGYSGPLAYRTSPRRLQHMARVHPPNSPPAFHTHLANGWAWAGPLGCTVVHSIATHTSPFRAPIRYTLHPPHHHVAKSAPRSRNADIRSDIFILW